ncbi:efflux RND transporter periplasmic adaptor subunit [Castellaniella sp.]|uniref:efflux RND transporter periplasmic adaptor subunit n=1 Tax=Castellaniella sp. TaxID=1955812 RepID=UPI0035640E89
MSSIRRILLLAAALLLGLGGLYWWQQHPSRAAPGPAAPAPVLVRLATVEVRDVPMRIQALGTGEAWQNVVVRPRIDGQLEELGFHEGDMVQQGQLLARLDDRIPRAQFDLAQAQLTRDQVQLENARADLGRYEQLAKRGAIERQVLDRQAAQVAVLEATVQADNAEVERARAVLDDTRILAPLGGRTGVINYDPGNQVRVSDAQGLVTIRQIDPMAVRFMVPDTEFPRIQAALHKDRALRVEVFDRASGESLGVGSLVLVDNQIDEASATLRLKARLDNPERRLWPGQTVDVRLILGHHPQALVVPEQAIQRGVDNLQVYVVEADGRVRLQPVQVEVVQDGMALVSAGLQAGEQVVIDGQYKLRPGLSIEAIEETS